MGLKQGREIRHRVIQNNQEATKNLVVNLPNVISALRVALGPVLVWLVVQHQANVFLAVLAFSLFTDVIDGYLARRFNQVTELGIRLDSWADLVTYAVMLLGLVQLWPTLYQRESAYLVIAFSAWIVPLLVCQARFGCFPSYHTLAAKVAAVGLAPAYFIAALWDQSLLLRMVLLFYCWVALEQVIITSILPHWQGNVPGFWTAAAIARDQSKKQPECEGQIKKPD